MIITRKQIRYLIREVWESSSFFTDPGLRLGSQIEEIINEMGIRFPLTMVTLGRLRERLRPLGVWDIDYSEEQRSSPENLYFQAGDQDTYLEFRWTPGEGLIEV